MPNQYKNKVIYGTTVLVDLTDATATADKIVSGYTAYGASGAKLTGSVVIQHYYTGSSDPASSLGVDGDIYLKTGS